MTQALTSAVAEATKLPLDEQDILAAIPLEEIASEQRRSRLFAKSEHVLEALAAEALADFKAGKNQPLDDLPGSRLLPYNRKVVSPIYVLESALLLIVGTVLLTFTGVAFALFVR
ncbi:MAG: hypothetical protein ACYDCY_05780, partial [Metallibacterium sp.]